MSIHPIYNLRRKTVVGVNLTGRVAVVTGSGQGIGRAIAIYLAKEGAKVVTNNRKPGSTGFAIMNEALVQNLSTEKKEWLRKEAEAANGDAATTAKAIKDMGGEAVPFFGDVSNFDVARSLIQTAVDTFGKIDILVNVVGTFRFSPIWEMSEEDWDHVCNIKPKAHFNCIRHALPFMMKQKYGRIINCTSGAFNGGGLRQVNYATANAGVMGLTFGVAKEVYKYGITCNAFAPSAQTRASFELTAYELSAPEDRGPWVDPKSTGALGKSPNPDDLAPFIAYLATEAAGNISCSAFFVGGNYVGMYSESQIAKSVTKYGGGQWTVDELKQQVPSSLLRGYRTPATSSIL
jgi:3-oxoacyl-[acyl-carrier protein] reductase